MQKQIFEIQQETKQNMTDNEQEFINEVFSPKSESLPLPPPNSEQTNFQNENVDSVKEFKNIDKLDKFKENLAGNNSEES